ncbi:MAG: disulfide bond formation protein B [Alphaproteobacteria bacterium]|nr:disulfide bond formation protein B [Alphaproteobacteria bacterium]
MNALLAKYLPPKRLPAVIAGVSAAILATANIFEHVFGYVPCQLCLYQRLPWWVALGLGCLAALVIKARPTLALLIAITALIAVAVGAGIAGYHAGVEYQFWPGPSGCSGTASLSGDLSQALSKVSEGPTGPSCDEAPWSLFGISMAGYNFLLSLGLVALGALAIRAAARKS